MKKICLKTTKILFVFCTLFSQLSYSLTVFAEEIPNNDEIINEENKNNIENEEIVDEEEKNDDEVEKKEKNDDESIDEEEKDEEEVIDEEEIIITEDEENDQILINGTFTRKILVKDVKNAFEDENVTILDDQMEILDEEDIVYEGCILVKNNKPSTIKVNGDYNKDGIVNEEDVELLINDMLVEEIDYDLNYVTNLLNAIKNKKFINEEPTSDKIEVSSSVASEGYVDEDVNMDVQMKGFENDHVNGVEGTIEYDKDILKIKEIKINKENKYGNINEENGKFVFVFDDYNNNEEPIITVVFTGVDSGESVIKISDLKISKNGQEVELINKEIESVTTINEYGVGGDSDEESDSNNSSEGVSNDIAPTQISYKNVNKYYLSSDNFIKSLEINGYEIDFDMNKLAYNIKVKNKVNSLDIKVELNDSRSSYAIEGNENFKDGENKVRIIVTAEDGSEKIYEINVNKQKVAKSKTTITDKNNKDSSKVIIIILIVLVIIGLIYVIFKDDEEEITIENSKDKTQNKKKNNNK